MKDDDFRLTREEELRYAEEGAWEPLRATFYKWMFGYFMGKTANPLLSKELTDYTMRRACRNLKKGKYDPSYRFSTFLHNIREKVWEGFRKQGIYYFSREVRNRLRSDRFVERDDKEPFDDLPVEDPPVDEGIDGEELLRVIFLYGGKPHQLVAFGFVKLLDWDPSEIVAELSDQPLADLGNRFCSEYYECFMSFLDRTRYRNYCCTVLLDKFDLPLKEVYTQKEYNRLSAYFGMPIGAVAMRPFYEPNSKPAQSLSNWCDKVKKNVEKAYGKPRPS